MTRILIILAAAALAGCSTVGEPRYDVGVSEHNNYDVEYVQAVERQARWVGTRVIWVHVPEVNDDDSDN